MKKIGIIGGLGPESTRDYYREIIDAFKDEYELSGFPEMVIESCDLKKFTMYASEGKWDYIAGVLSKKCENLVHSGADFIAIASNTPHKVFRQVNEICSVPIISIIEATRSEAMRRAVKKLCLLGTPFTMRESFYHDVFAGSGIELVVPRENDQAFIGKTLFEEIELGIINEATKKEYLNIIARVCETEYIDGVIMGCTELPMILKPEDIAGEYFDTLKIHVREIVRKCKE